MLIASVSILALAVAILALSRAFTDHRVVSKKIGELRQQLMQAESQLRYRSNLASEIAHDIKNPLTAILCSAEALHLMLGDSIAPAHRKTLMYIREYGEQLLRLLGDFLDINRLHSGNLSSVKEEVHLLEVSESVVGLLRAYAQRQEVEVRIIEASCRTTAFADPTHTKQILFNLIQNAIKFSPPNSEVTILIRDLTPLPQVMIEVADNGVGMTPETVAKIFDPYAHFDDPRLGKREGLGLGLALCRSLVALEKGEMTVQSVPSRGTIFTVQLPAASSIHSDQSNDLQSPILVKGSSEMLAVLEGQQFLVIDTDHGAREAVTRLIEAWGGMVDSVKQAEEAIEAISHKKYDAIVLDIPNDGEDSKDLARLIRENLTDKKTRIIVSHAQQLHGGQADAADRTVEKPMNGRKILDALLVDGLH